MAKKRGIVVSALVVFLLLATAMPVRAWDRDEKCEHRIHKAEQNLEKAIRKHGEHSEQAERRRHELEEMRERCRHDRDHDRR